MIRIGVLSINENHDNASLLEYFAKLESEYNAKSYIIYPKNIQFKFSNKDKDRKKDKYIYYNNKRIKLDVILPRIDSDVSFKDFVLALNAMDYIRNHTSIPVINYTKGMLISNDKFWQGEYISAHGYVTPKTAMVSSVESIPNVLKEFNSYPLIIKSQFGAGGAGVSIVESERSAKSVVNSMIFNGQSVVIQEYLPVKNGKDYRLFVVGNKVIKGIVRKAPKKDFRANVAIGGKKGFFKPSKELQNVAIDIANLVGLEIAAVDFMFYDGQYYFIEINKNPGTKNDIDAARTVLEYVVDRAKKKIKKLKKIDKQYKIETILGVKKVFRDLDVNIFAMSKSAFRKIVPSFFVDKYHIISYAKTNDIPLLRKYCKVRSVQERDTDFVNYNSSLHENDQIDFAEMENYLRRYRDRHLYISEKNEIVENIFSQISMSLVYTNMPRVREQFENKLKFRRFLEENGFDISQYKNLDFQEFLAMKYKEARKIFDDDFVIQFPVNTAQASRNTFVIKNAKEFANLKKLIKKQTYRHKEIKSVDVVRYVKGKIVAINACIANKKVLLGNVGLQLIDIDELYNKKAIYRNKRCGYIWGTKLITDKEKNLVCDITTRIGNQMISKSKYRGQFSLEMIICNNQVYVIGCKTHSTTSSVIEDLVRLSNNVIPLEVFQLLESFEIKYNYNENKIVHRLGKNKKYSVLYLYNIANKQIDIKKHINSGIYEFDSRGNIKYKKESILPKDFSDIKHEFILSESITEKDKYIEVQDSDSKILNLIFPQVVIGKNGSLNPRIKKVIIKIYKKLGI
jgi:ribosomal protein S6--L-glutamate ligase